MSARALLLGVLLLSLFPATFLAQSVDDPALMVEEVVSGLSAPTQMEFIGADDILVTEHSNGRVRRVQAGVITATVLDVHVNTAGPEHGLLGLAVHPDFGTNGFVYICYSESSTGMDTNVASEYLGNRIYRYTWDGAALTSPVLILDIPTEQSGQHDGGILNFGPDDKLYATVGDQNHNGQLQNFSAGGSPDSTSVIFRLNDDGSVPVDNPLVAVPGYEAYFGYGMRNCFGYDFDPVTGALWQADNGPSTYDEVNRVDPGMNSGWERIMGPVARDPQGTSDLVIVSGAFYTDPAFSWFDSRGVTALEFLASSALGAQYENDVFVADIVFGRIYHFEPDSARTAFVLTDPELQDRVADADFELVEVSFATNFGGITDLDTGPDGYLYVLRRSPGRIYRILPYPSSGVPLDRPPNYALLQNTPNPFAPTTTFTFVLPEAARVSLVVYDVRGRKVATLLEGVQPAGRQKAVWDGRTDSGTPLSSGVYFVRLESRFGRQVRRAVLLR